MIRAPYDPLNDQIGHDIMGQAHGIVGESVIVTVPRAALERMIGGLVADGIRWAAHRERLLAARRLKWARKRWASRREQRARNEGV